MCYVKIILSLYMFVIISVYVLYWWSIIDHNTVSIIAICINTMEHTPSYCDVSYK